MTPEKPAICAHCGHENEAVARFCQQCGQALLPLHSTAPLNATRQSKPADHDTLTFGAPDWTSKTRPLPGASIAFSPLPEGAILQNGRYVIIELLRRNEKLNVYLTEDIAPARICPVCATALDNAEERFCPQCGADLSGAEPRQHRHRISESKDGREFTSEAQLLKMHLEHPGLLLPQEYFIEAPYGPPRHYLVEPEQAPPLVDTLAIPQKLERVLAWGISLAQSMHYLHQRQVTLRDIGLKNIVTQENEAQWVHLRAATVIPPAERSDAARYFAEDVQNLATLLVYLATGHQARRSRLPESVDAIFSKALTDPPQYNARQLAEALDYARQMLNPPENVTFAIGHCTDVGRTRSLNEDSLLTMHFAPEAESEGITSGLFAVADGMGGHTAGDVASQLIVQTIKRQANEDLHTLEKRENALNDPRHWLESAVAAANQSVYEQRRIADTDMGSTLVAALLVNNQATIANVGDSRAYLLTETDIIQITTDHSLVERLVAAGQITSEEAIDHPQKNVIYRVIGDKPQTQVDLFQQHLANNQALLLCSDGLNGFVPDETIWRTWREAPTPQAACERLVDLANQAGGKDNITVVIVQTTY